MRIVPWEQVPQYGGWESFLLAQTKVVKKR
jgi:hypothetical protein